MDLASFGYCDHLALRIIKINGCDFSGVCLVHSLEEKSGTIKDPNLPRHPSKSNQVESAAVVHTVNCDCVLYFFLSLLLKVLLTLFLDFPMAFVATALLGLTSVSELIQLLGEV